MRGVVFSMRIAAPADVSGPHAPGLMTLPAGRGARINES